MLALELSSGLSKIGIREHKNYAIGSRHSHGLPVAIYGQQGIVDRRGPTSEPESSDSDGPNLLKIRNISGVFVGVS